MSHTINNDRSNIELLLDNEKMDKLLNAADWVSKRACDKYEFCDLYKLNPEASRYYRFLSASKVHQIFDGLNLEYSKEFRDFILQNKEVLIGDYELTSLIKAFQEKIIELSKQIVFPFLHNHACAIILFASSLITKTRPFFSSMLCNIEVSPAPPNF